jgi:hypothetical protein
LSPDPSLLGGVLRGLEESNVAGLVREALWLYPAVEILHIAGFVILVGSAFVLDLRLLGRLRSLPAADLVPSLSRWARRSMVLVVLSGFILFSVDATALAANPAFQIKLVLVAAAVVNASVFHLVIFRGAHYRQDSAWREDAPLPFAARAVGILSLILWFSVIAFGRLIAYV